ncbi:endoribonuclease Dicer-like protein 2 [Pyrus ussuriensis x Pyrus communis]|uniref:Endoribonuclease Dicer-like protein 2 n=1 Tax=Pyrus ussuriensis x Pyrus communis TaxID=2448454 RepID=A0A5N5F7U4_9ROSA|nr:endoribonuclease Dicer-like protein 2 [Pyrus ussuriensis x Pyrus communis]
MEIDGAQLSADFDPLPFARNYQLEAMEAAIKNTIVFLETASEETLIGIMLLRTYTCSTRLLLSLLSSWFLKLSWSNNYAPTHSLYITSFSTCI